MASPNPVSYFEKFANQQAEKSWNTVLEGAEQWTAKFVLHVSAIIECAEDVKQTRRDINRVVTRTLQQHSKRLHSLDSMAFEMYRNFWFKMTKGKRRFLYEDAKPEPVTFEPFVNPTVIFHDIENDVDPFEAWRQYVEGFIPAIQMLPALTNPNQELVDMEEDIQVDNFAPECMTGRAEPEDVEDDWSLRCWAR